jgi:hypothetical protein
MERRRRGERRMNRNARGIKHFFSVPLTAAWPIIRVGDQGCESFRLVQSCLSIFSFDLFDTKSLCTPALTSHW